MKIAKTLLIIFLLSSSMVIGIIPLTKAANQDSFGYTYTDSKSDGVPYSWNEISETGTPILPDLGSIAVNNLDLGFNFNYYGQEYSQLTVGLCGLLIFNPVNNIGWEVFNNQPIAESTNLNGFIAPYWTGIWNGLRGGAVYIQTKGEAPNRQFIVEWYDLNTYSNSSVTFEAILTEGSNSILFQYGNVEFDQGISATVGIEDYSGTTGVQYSYKQPVISSGLAVLIDYPGAVIGTDLYSSINAPLNVDKGTQMTYNLFYTNLGDTTAKGVILEATLSNYANFVAASDNGVYDSATRKVTWDIGSVAGFHSSNSGSKTVTVVVPLNIQDNAEIISSAHITSYTLETNYDNNFASGQTTVIPSPPPVYISVDAETGVKSGPTRVYWVTPTAFQYQDATASGVDVIIHFADEPGFVNQPDVVASMNGPAPTWTYIVTFDNLNPPRHGTADVTYTVHYPSQPQQTVEFSIYIDPSGYIYDANTLEHISGANVWLQMPNGRGGWMNVPTGDDPALMQPDLNPQTSDETGHYQWNTLPGTYRIHVEAPGYYPADSIAVTVPPPVTDLHVGLIPLTDDPPPVTTLYIGAPKQTDSSGIIQVTSSTSFTLTAQDNYGGSGVASTTYRISNSQYSSGWISTNPPTTFRLNGLADAGYTIEYFSTDFSGNVESTKTVAVTLVSGQTITSLGPAKIWVGLKNSDDVGIKFDLKAEVYKNGVLIGSGQLNSVLTGSSGFNNAKLNSIPITLTSQVQVFPGDSLTLKIYERNAAVGSGKNSGNARLWYNDAQANSTIELTTGLSHSTHYLLSGFLTGHSTGVGPKNTIDVAAGAKGSAFKLFGAWEIQIP